MNRLPLILCPTSLEVHGIRDALASLGLHTQCEQCGLGPGGVLRFAASARRRFAADLAPGRVVILAGLAGGIDPAHRAGLTRCARYIVAAGADECRPSPRYLAPLRLHDGMDIASVDRIAFTAEEKRAIFDATGAAMVDMESAAFAALASARKWRWGVVRTISDDATTPLPHWIADIIRSDGSTNYRAVAHALLRDPRRISLLMAIARHTPRMLRSCAQEIARLLDASASTEDEDHEYRTLVMGGSFDPPHRLHAAVARAAAAQLGCGRILVVPAGESPLKSEPARASARERIELARLAFADVAHATVDTREVERGGQSYTVDTLRSIASERLLSRRSLVLLIGADQAMQFDKWKEWREIDEQLATIAIVARGREGQDELRRALRAKFSALGSDGDRWAHAVLDIDPVDLSSTHLREQLARGESVGDAIAPAVLARIRSLRLYQ